MSNCREAVAALGLVLLATWGSATWAQPGAAFPGIGRAATPKEVQSWDIDVRPDFKGLPAGSGSVAKGQDVWEAKCASCHGIFGESNEIFSPLIGGTTKQDIQTGRVARLNDTGFPGRTTLMKVANLSTLWDYINRAMPWNTPKSLTVEEVYAVTAYMLNMGDILPASFVLSDKNIAQVQALMPNRNGMSTDHNLWPGKTMGHRKPDVVAAACMTDCEAEPKLASFLPDFARNAHGNLAEQNRLVGPQRGADTTRPAGAAPLAAAAVATAAAPAARSGNAAAIALTGKHTCTACHGMDNRLVGPSFAELARKYAGGANAETYLADKIKNGGQGVWGAIPMPPQALPDTDARSLAQWIAGGAKK